MALVTFPTVPIEIEHAPVIVYVTYIHLFSALHVLIFSIQMEVSASQLQHYFRKVNVLLVVFSVISEWFHDVIRAHITFMTAWGFARIIRTRHKEVPKSVGRDERHAVSLCSDIYINILHCAVPVRNGNVRSVLVLLPPHWAAVLHEHWWGLAEQRVSVWGGHLHERSP